MPSIKYRKMYRKILKVVPDSARGATSPIHRLDVPWLGWGKGNDGPMWSLLPHSPLQTAITFSGIIFKNIQQQWSFWQIIRKLTLMPISFQETHTDSTLIYTQFTCATISMENVWKQNANMRQCPKPYTSDYVDNYTGHKFERKTSGRPHLL